MLSCLVLKDIDLASNELKVFTMKWPSNVVSAFSISNNDIWLLEVILPRKPKRAKDYSISRKT